MLIPLLSGGNFTKTASTNELNFLLSLYTKIFPLWTFPYIPLSIAAIFQSLAWMSGPNLFKSTSLLPRLFIMWLLAGGEYLFMMPTMNAGIEIIGITESVLVIIYQVLTSIIFIFINIFVFKKEFNIKYCISFVLLILSVIIINY